MARKIVVIGADLMARSRLEPAAARVGAELAYAPSSSPAEAAGADLVIVDLDAVGAAAAAAVAAGATPVIGYYSHVDAALAGAARAAGIEPIPRGRFWRDLDALLGG